MISPGAKSNKQHSIGNLMHRRNLLSQLLEYKNRYPDEQATVERFMAFVQSQPRCFERDCWQGHVTGSAWLVDPQGEALLLTHHRKLNMWLQLGGHSDGDADTQRVAVREAQEESGLAVVVLSPSIFDLDIHEIPGRKSDPAHFHFDVRYVLQAQSAAFVVSDESVDLSWVALTELEQYTREYSILRMREKWIAHEYSAGSGNSG